MKRGEASASWRSLRVFLCVLCGSLPQAIIILIRFMVLPQSAQSNYAKCAELLLLSLRPLRFQFKVLCELFLWLFHCV